MRQRVLLIVLCFCSFLVNAEDTVLKLYRPFGDVSEQIIPVVKAHLTGQCDTQSHLLLREDTWRCFADGTVYDPCFAKSGAAQTKVLCPQSPWTEVSVEIEVSSPLVSEHHVSLDMSRALPWGIELVNGAHCLAVGAGEQYDSMPVRYRCSNQGLLIGYLQRCKALWSMLEKTPDGVVTAEFKKVWF